MDEPIRYYTILDGDDFPVAFFTSDIWPEVPERAIEITEDQWRECLQNPSGRRLVNDELLVVDPPRGI